MTAVKKNIGYKNQKKDDSNIILTLNGGTCHEQKTSKADHFSHLLQQFHLQLFENYHVLGTCVITIPLFTRTLLD